MIASGLGNGVRAAVGSLTFLLTFLLTPARAQSSLDDDARGPLQIDRHRDSGAVLFLSGQVASGADGTQLTSSPVDTALTFLDRHEEALGMPRVGTSLQPAARAVAVDHLGMTHVRLDQELNGVPVYGAQLVVHFGADGDVSALNGNYVTSPYVSTVPTVGPWRAVRIARSIEPESRLVGEPTLSVVTPRIVPDLARAHLVWLVKLYDETTPALRLFMVDAHSEVVVKTRDELCSARFRRVYDLGGATSGNGILVRSEGQGPTGDADVNAAYDYTGDAYDYFQSMFGRDGYDDNGATIVSRVHLGIGLLNAFWSGSELLFGDGMAADDIVVHEYVHAVTDATAGLIYENESGALSEAYSDIFGEVVDQLNGAGNDSPAALWELGEDSPIGAFRDMANPGLLGQPDRVTTWRCTALDNGGVHTNSGVINKAAYLMAEGGTFNEVTINPLGIETMARVHYRALTVYLTPAATVLEHFLAMNQACLDLAGTPGVQTSDCIDVNKAMLAAEMHLSVICNITCPVQTAALTAPPGPAGPGPVGPGGGQGPVTSGPTAVGPSRAQLIATAYRLRTRLQRSPRGRRWTELYYEHAGAVSDAMQRDPGLAPLLGAALARTAPELESALDGTGPVTLSPHAVALGAAFLRRLEGAVRGTELATVIAAERASLDVETLAGRALDEVLDGTSRGSLAR